MEDAKLSHLLWLMRYSWRLEEEDHVRIYPDGKVQVMKFKAEAYPDKSYLTSLGLGYEVVAEFSSIKQLLDRLQQEENLNEHEEDKPD